MKWTTVVRLSAVVTDTFMYWNFPLLRRILSRRFVMGGIIEQPVVGCLGFPSGHLPEIPEVLTHMDAELPTLEQRQEKTRALKQAMMQELLTGRIRLV
jgi:hypothetical protein